MVLTLVTFLVSCGAKDKRKKFDKAADYNDYIIDIVDGVDEAWSTSIEEEDKDKAFAWSDSLANRSKAGLTKLTNLQPFKKDSTFRDASTKYITHMSNISNKELKEFLTLIHGEEFTLESEQKAEALLPILDDQREKLFEDIKTTQKAFAAKFNIILL